MPQAYLSLDTNSQYDRRVSHLLCCKWLFTRSPAVNADMSESSAASTVPHTILANDLALSPGHSLFGPVITHISQARQWLS